MNPKDKKPPVIVKVGDDYYWTGFYKDKEIFKEDSDLLDEVKDD